MTFPQAATLGHRTCCELVVIVVYFQAEFGSAQTLLCGLTAPRLLALARRKKGAVYSPILTVLYTNL